MKMDINVWTFYNMVATVAAVADGCIIFLVLVWRENGEKRHQCQG